MSDSSNPDQVGTFIAAQPGWRALLGDGSVLEVAAWQCKPLAPGGGPRCVPMVQARFGTHLVAASARGARRLLAPQEDAPAGSAHVAVQITELGELRWGSHRHGLPWPVLYDPPDDEGAASPPPSVDDSPHFKDPMWLRAASVRHREVKERAAVADFQVASPLLSATVETVGGLRSFLEEIPDGVRVLITVDGEQYRGLPQGIGVMSPPRSSTEDLPYIVLGHSGMPDDWADGFARSTSHDRLVEVHPPDEWEDEPMDIHQYWLQGGAVRVVGPGHPLTGKLANRDTIAASGDSQVLYRSPTHGFVILDCDP